MSSPSSDLPQALRELQSRPLFVMRLEVPTVESVGPAPGGFRRVGLVTGGTFTGSRLSGEVLASGNDWQQVRTDGSTTLDVRVLLRTQDRALIAMTYRGIRHGPVDVLERLDKGLDVDPAAYYFRTLPLFETADARYDWLNRVAAVGIGHRQSGAAVYSVFEIL
jgi:hypothetical protein